VSASVVGAVLVLAIVLALPDHAGITRAAAHPRRSFTPAVTTAAVPHATPKPSGPGLPQASLTIAPTAAATNLPTSFLGLSTEYWALPLFDRDMPAFERVLSLLHVPGAGPVVLRIGGDSADHSFWDPKVRKMPSWAFALTPSFLKQLNEVVRRENVRLIIDLNLLTDTPVTAATWARAAETSLPHGSVVGFEIGNEPDIYQRSYWLAAITRSPLKSLSLPLELTPSMYVQDFQAYAAALQQNAPGIPLDGPAVAHPSVDRNWIATLLDDDRPSLGAVTGHMYPYSACAERRSSSYPTIARVLSQRASAGMATAVEPAVRMAHAAGLPFRLTEINSVTCGGLRGVSNTFATALWAPDALFDLARAGVNGVNLHVRADAVNAPFTINRGGLYARPLMYGLLMFTRMLGPHTQLVRLDLHAKPSLNLKAWATRVSGGILHVLLIDKGNHSVRVDLHLPATGPATVQRLLAPSVRSRFGVTIDGQRLSRNGTWIGQAHNETIMRGAAGYELTVSRHSEALLSVHMASTPAAAVAPAAGALVRTRAATRRRAGRRHTGLSPYQHSAVEPKTRSRSAQVSLA
jgi:hypothetical protein